MPNKKQVTTDNPTAIDIAPETPVRALRNLGPKSEKELAAIGIHTYAQLRKKGAIAAFVEMRDSAKAREKKTLSSAFLYALFGALHAIDWLDVVHNHKVELLLALKDFEEGKTR